jgi:fatty acid-binding protein DegV
VVEWLGLTPIAKIKPSGRMGMAGGLFGTSNVPVRFADYVAKRVDRTKAWRLVVGHCDAPSDGEALLASLRSRIDVREGWLVETGSAIGAHAGPGALVVSLQPLD